jgi:hypothetical protein
MGMEMPDPEGVGVAFARPFKGRISKCQDKGADGINAPVLGTNAADGEGK